MKNARARLVSSALGASGGLAGMLSLSNCTGGSCTSCFGCAGAGVGILLLVLYGKMKRTTMEDNNGMA